MATWAKGMDFKNSANTARVGGVGIYGNDGSAEKAYLAIGQEPWNNAGLEVTSSAITFKGNKIYHAGSKPTPSEIGAAAASHGTHVTYSSTAPLANGTASAGSASTVSRTDHVHPLQTTVSGNAGTATKLQTARTISVTGHATGSASFDGSANASIALTLANSGVTAGSYGPNDNTSSSFGGTISIPEVTVDAKGRVTSATTRTVTLPSNPNSDTKVTNTLNTTAKAYVTGTTSATTNTGTQVFDTGVYLDTTAGRLVATTFAGALSGNATTATTLQTARTINGTSFNGSANITTANWGTARTLTIGDSGKSVNGSGNISWSLAEIGALPHKRLNTIQDLNELKTTGIYSIAFSGNTNCPTTGHGTLIVDFNVGTPYQIWIADSATTIYKRTYNNSSSAWNSWSSSYAINASTATTLQTARTINGTNFNGSANITTANWGTARTITIGNTGKSVNGSGNVTWSLSEIGAAAASHTHSYLPLSGGTMTGDLSTTGVFTVKNGTADVTLKFINDVPSIRYGGTGTGSSSGFNIVGTGDNLKVKIDDNGDIYAKGTNKVYHTGNKPTLTDIGAAAASHTHNYAGSSSAGGAATTALACTGNAATATTLATARTINGTSFNGSANITTANWGTARSIYVADSDGTNTGTAVSVNGSANATLKLPATIKASLTGNASTATTLQTARTLTIGNTGKTFNGSANVSWSLSEIGAAASSHTHNYAGSSSAGGAANSAVKLATARTISLGGILSGSANFDGSGNITISAAANDITTITKSLTVTTSWIDTGITGTNLGSGTYAVQMYVNDGTNTSQYQEFYSGIMSWFNGTTNSSDADEILLHKAGHASNGRHVYLRTIRTASSGYLKLQISSTHAFTAASSIVFKFKKLI